MYIRPRHDCYLSEMLLSSAVALFVVATVLIVACIWHTNQIKSINEQLHMKCDPTTCEWSGHNK